MTARGVGAVGVPVRRREVDARTLRLTVLATLLSAGHHVDHVVRGTHLGWPLTAEVTPFTVSLVVYPLVALGLALSLAGRVGNGYWLLVSGPGAVLLGAVHVGPVAVEHPGEILAGYAEPGVGLAAVGLLVALVALLVALSVREARALLRGRRLPERAPVTRR